MELSQHIFNNFSQEILVMKSDPLFSPKPVSTATVNEVTALLDNDFIHAISSLRLQVHSAVAQLDSIYQRVEIHSSHGTPGNQVRRLEYYALKTP